MTIDGHTYSMVQRVTNRALATYENVLIINQPVSESTFTCTVTNTLGSDTSDSIEGMFIKTHRMNSSCDGITFYSNRGCGQASLL